MALEFQGWDAHYHSHNRGNNHSNYHAKPWIQTISGRQNSRYISTNTIKGGLPEGYLSGITHQQAEADGDQTIDSGKNHEIGIILDRRNQT